MKKLPKYESFEKDLGEDALLKIKIIYYPKVVVASIEKIISGRSFYDYRRYSRSTDKEKILKDFNI